MATSTVQAMEQVLEGARCWGLELEPRYRVLSVTIEPDPLRTPGTPGEHQLLCFPVSTLLVALTRPERTDGPARATLLTFELSQLTAVSERLGGATITGPVLGLPEPRPGAWGPRYSLEGRTSAPDGTRTTLTLDLRADEDVRLRVFARFDDVELRDGARRVVLTSTGRNLQGEEADEGPAGSAQDPTGDLRF